MSYNLIAIPSFERELKQLSKKYPSIHEDYEALLDSLEKNPQQGTALGKSCYKIRMAIRSKGRGKSAGARVIICVKVIGEIVYLLSIYDKSEKESLTSKELEELLNHID